MSKTTIPYSQTRFFSNLMLDYLENKEHLKPFFNRFPEIENFEKQAKEKTQNYPLKNRKALVKALEEQYNLVNSCENTKRNINLLKNENTFTITTGHQLNLFTGPLYFLYKIVSAINLAKQLKEAYPNKNFVPVYWMASEDHDFEEINYFNFRGKKIKWHKEASGAVGELETNGLNDVLKIYSKELGLGDNAAELIKWFEDAYLKHENLADATFYLANQLFGEHGLVILDANKKALKNLFVPQIKDEILNRKSFQTINQTNERLEQLNKNYKIQVNPREINFFYNTKNSRERIVYQNNKYEVLNTSISFSEEALINDIENNSENYSPNVVLRPLYQEVILPNLCYIGGGGEMAYWFQLKDNFEAFQTTFPILLLRNSVLIQTKNQSQKLAALNLNIKDLFLEPHQLRKKVVLNVSEIEVDFSQQKEFLKAQFKSLYDIAKKTDKSFIGAVAAQEKKQINGLDNLEKRLLKAQKRKFKDATERAILLQQHLFPNGSLQERQENFSSLYLEYGEDLIPKLLHNLEPLKPEFTVLTF